MKSFIYEFLHTYRNYFVVASMIGIVALSVLSGLTIRPPNPSQGVPQSTIMFNYYVDNGTLNFDAYAFNDQGFPASTSVYGSTVVLSVAEAMNYTLFDSPYTPNNGVRLADYQNSSLSFGSSGWGNTTVPLNQSVQYYLMNVQEDTFSNQASILLYISSNLTYNESTQYTMEQVQSQKTYYQQSLMLVYFGDRAVPVSPSVTLYYGAASKSGYSQVGSIFNASGLTEVSTYSGFNVLRVNVVQSMNKSLYNETVTFYLVNSAGYLVSTGDYGPFVTQPSSQGNESQTFASAGSLFGILIPFLAVFLGYSSYGGPRSSGTLESTLVRRVERYGPIISRYAANASAIAISLAVSTGIMYYLAYKAYGVPPGSTFIYETFFSYLSTGLAFLGMVYLFSHLLKSNTQVLVVSMVFFVIFGMFWSIFPNIIANSVLKLPYDSAAYTKVFVDSFYLSPGTIPELMFIYDTKSMPNFGISSINPALVGVTPSLIILDSLIWLVIPVIMAVYLSAKRD